MSDILATLAQLGRRDYCPCKSGKRLEACCLVGGLLRPRIADVNPRGVRTGYANPGCYLSVVDDNCVPKLNREHFISKSILEVLHVDGGSRGVRLEGLPWQTVVKPLPPNAFASRILCERHNSALSPLDTCALRFFRCLMNVPKHLRNPSGKRDQLYMFSGPDLERWMIKLLAGLLISGNATLDGDTLRMPVPPGWLEVLMARKNLPPGVGLGSMEVLRGEPQDVPTSIDVRPMFLNQNDKVEPAGAHVWINGLALGLLLVNIPDKRGSWAADFRPHANTFKFTGPSSSVTVLLAGPGWDTSTGVEINWLPGRTSRDG